MHVYDVRKGRGRKDPRDTSRLARLRRFYFDKYTRPIPWMAAPATTAPRGLALPAPEAEFSKLYYDWTRRRY